MIDDLEEEVTEMRAIAVRSGAVQVQALENETKKLKAELDDLKTQNEVLLRESREWNKLRHFSQSNLRRKSFYRIQEGYKFITAERSWSETAEEIRRK